jgi:hypothetical protein
MTTRQIKTALLLLALVIMAYSFGFEVGHYAARSDEAMRNAKRVLREMSAFMKGGDDVAKG